MGLLSRRGARTAPPPEPIGHTWAPITGDIYTAPASHVDDVWAAGDAYGADYRLAGSTSPSILTAWAYPAHAGFDEDDGYMVVTAFGHLFYDDDGEPYGSFTRAASDDTLIYRDLAAADRAALACAQEMARTTWTSAGATGRTGFDWDGEPC